MKFSYNILLFIATVSILFTSCQKDDDDHDHHHHEDPTLTLKMDHRWKSMNLYIDEAKNYDLDNGQSITLSEFRYYLTNLELKRADGTWWQEEESYRIVDASNQLDEIVIHDIPEGEYTDVRFLIGVDSVRNFSGAQEGALAPSENMFWSWNTGYIFVRVEGTSESIEAEDKSFEYHIGGFRDPFIASRPIEASFGRELMIRPNSGPSIHFHVFADRFFEGEAINIDLNQMSRMHMPNENTVRVADNYSTMIEYDHIHN